MGRKPKIMKTTETSEVVELTAKDIDAEVKQLKAKAYDLSMDIHKKSAEIKNIQDQLNLINKNIQTLEKK